MPSAGDPEEARRRWGLTGRHRLRGQFGRDMLRPGGAAVTKSLEEVFARASRLSAEEQDALAAWLAEELESDERWGRLFARSQIELGRLADEALGEHAAGKTEGLDHRDI